MRFHRLGPEQWLAVHSGEGTSSQRLHLGVETRARPPVQRGIPGPVPDSADRSRRDEVPGWDATYVEQPLLDRRRRDPRGLGGKLGEAQESAVMVVSVRTIVGATTRGTERGTGWQGGERPGLVPSRYWAGLRWARDTQ